MQITKVTFKTKCDFAGCKNMATAVVRSENDLNKKLNLCDECLTSIYEAIAKSVVPKGIDAPFKKQRKLR